MGDEQPDSGAQIAFMNPGGLRADLVRSPGDGDPDGTVTYRRPRTVQPFANTLVTMDLTGAQIKPVLEQQWQRTREASRPFLKLGVSEGFEYTRTTPTGAPRRLADPPR